MSFKTDAQIAREADIRPIREIAAKLSIGEEQNTPIRLCVFADKLQWFA